MLDKNLVEGFSIDTQPQKPDFVLNENKLWNHSVNHSKERLTQRTHPYQCMGKYSVASINGNKYYILSIDDSKKFSTMEFLKQKGEAGQKVKEYLTYLKTQDKKPKVICVEFINND